MDIEKKHFIYSLVIPLFYLIVIFSIKSIEVLKGIELYRWGVRPLSLEGMPGIIFSPLLHKDWEHLIGNSLSFIVLAWSLFYFYRKIALKVFLLLYLFSGAWLWFGARDAYHIGSSGIVYGMASFLFFSGVVRRYFPLIAISLFIVFSYGSMVWGIFPFKFNMDYSWEAHLWGTIAGITLAVVYRHEGPQKTVRVWSDDELDDEDPFWKNTDITDP